MHYTDKTRPSTAEERRSEAQSAVDEFLANGGKIDERKPGETNITPKVLLSTGRGNDK